MRKRICIIGLSSFGERSLQMLANLDVELIIIDRDREKIQNFKDQVSDAYIVDVSHFEAVKKVIPRTIDIAIIDLGKNVEASILIASHLKKIGIEKIVARAESNQHGSILDMVGATKVVYPNQEAVKRVIPVLISDSLLNYIPINDEIIILEVTIPEQHLGKNAVELDLRNKFNINIIAVRNNENSNYKFLNARYKFCKNDKALIAGSETDIMKFLNIFELKQKVHKPWNIKKLISLFNKNKV